MSRLTWGDPGTKFFETGIDRGVLYVDSAGYAWNGLTAVTESPTGGEPKPFYADGLKYLNLSSAEEFEATIDAFGSPDAFGPCDGRQAVYNGLFVGQQPRKAFSMAYRTLVGNDTLSKNYGYKIHLIWNALAAPTERAYTTNNESPEGVGMSWSITTLPPSMTGYKPTAYMEIDSRFTPKGLLKAVEDILFGSDAADARMPFQSELAQMFKSEGPTMRRNYALNASFRASATTVEVVRNYIKNPSYRVTSGTVERTRNMCTNPNPTTVTGYSSAGGAAVAAPWDATRWAFKGTATGSSTFYLFSAPAESTIVSGTPVTVSGMIQVPAGKYYRVYVHVRTGNYYYSSATAPYVLSDGKPVRVSKTETLTSDAPDVDLAILVYDTNTGTVLAAGNDCYMGDVMIQKSTIVNPYFDGDTPAAGDFSYAWVGTAKASSSIQKGAYIPNVAVNGNTAMMQSTAWTRPGRSYSLRIASLYDFNGSGYVDLATLVGTTTSGMTALVKGQTYTVSGWFYSPPATPNTAGGITFTVLGVTGLGKTATVAPGGGEQFLSLTFTVPTDAAVTGVYVRLQNSLPRGVADLWVSDLMFVDGGSRAAFFDGNTPASDGLTYSWSGAVDASAPIATGNRVSNWSNGTTGEPFYRTGTADDQGGYFAEIRDTAIAYMSAAAVGNIGEYWAARITLGPSPDTPAGSSVRFTIHDGTGYVTTLDPAGGADGYIAIPSVPTEIVAYSKSPLVNTSPRIYVYPVNSNTPVRVAKAILERVDGPGMAPGSFFDGNTPNAGGYFYHWDGAVDASTSYVNTWN